MIKKAKETILIVEDELALLELYRNVLEKEGYNIIEAKDGEEGVQIYERLSKSISIALIDLGLPKLDGRKVFTRFKEINPEVKVIFMSGYIDENLSSELLAAGGKALIQKPSLPNLLVSNVSKLLNT